MEYRRLGTSDITVSAVGLGCWPMAGVGWTGIDDVRSLAAIETAIDQGITLIDTAFMYGRNGESERLVGKAVAGKRDSIILATKCGIHWAGEKMVRNSSREQIIQEVEESLRRLNTDYIDLYQVHAHDPDTPVEETAQTLADLKTQGKIRAVGVSNYDVPCMEAFALHAPLHSNQPPYNMIMRDIEEAVVPYCLKNDIGLITYWPLYKGLLTGKYGADHRFPGEDSRATNEHFQGERLKRTLDMLERLRSIADAYGKTITQFVIHWTARRPGVTSVLCGATRPEHAAQNAAAVDNPLSDEDMELVNRIIGAA